MTLQQLIPYSHLIQAAKEGKVIQTSVKIGVWSDINYDREHFIHPPCFYRIKPTPTLRPWKLEEVPVGTVAKIKDFKHKLLIIAAFQDTIWIGLERNITYKDALDKYEHSLDLGKTWLPCGVEE